MEERRQHPRWLARAEAYVVCYAPEPDYIGQVLDISLDGIAFNFLETREMSGEPVAVGILEHGVNYFLRKLPFRKSYSNVPERPPREYAASKAFRGKISVADTPSARKTCRLYNAIC